MERNSSEVKCYVGISPPISTGNGVICVSDAGCGRVEPKRLTLPKLIFAIFRPSELKLYTQTYSVVACQNFSEKLWGHRRPIFFYFSTCPCDPADEHLHMHSQ